MQKTYSLRSIKPFSMLMDLYKRLRVCSASKYIYYLLVNAIISQSYQYVSELFILNFENVGDSHILDATTYCLRCYQMISITFHDRCYIDPKNKDKSLLQVKQYNLMLSKEINVSVLWKWIIFQFFFFDYTQVLIR